MKTINALILMGTVSSFAQSDLHLMEGSVARLSGKVQQHETISGVEYEKWLKHPTNEHPFPVRATVAGTGFFVRSDKLLYLVTAKHVAQAMMNEVTIVARGSNSQPIELRLVDFSPIRAPLWLMDSVSDIGVHPLVVFKQEDVEKLRFLTATHWNDLVTESNAPPKNMSLHMVGFPDAEGEGIGFSPSKRTSTSETGLRKNSQGTLFFQLQLPGIDGYSGAPVFESADSGIPSSRAKIWGLLSATRSDSSGGKGAIIIHALQIRRIIEGFEGILPKVEVATNAPPVVK